MYQKHASMCRISAVVKNAPIDLASGISWSSWRLMMRTARTIRSSFTSLIILTIFIVRRSAQRAFRAWRIEGVGQIHLIKAMN